MVHPVDQSASSSEVTSWSLASSLKSFYGLSLEDLQGWMAERGEKSFRAGQVMKWVYQEGAQEWEAMSNVSLKLREALAKSFSLEDLPVVRVQGSEDTTRKFLFRLGDGKLIETVLIPASPALYGSRSDRRTLCVSSQVGCAYGCKFCASGLRGWSRNLTAAEIVQQVWTAQRVAGKRIHNLVFMGMGEPLANVEELLKAIEILNAQWGLGIGARQMTVSTSGLAPQIRQLAEQPLQVRLAVSLHGARDEVRDQIMPVNRKYPLEVLFEALKFYREHKKQRVTFEYILIEGVNDRMEDAEALIKKAQSVNAKVNLIPYNTVEGLEWKRPEEKVLHAFCDKVKAGGVFVTMRLEKGHDIEAACGQLRLQEEDAAAPSAP